MKNNIQLLLISILAINFYACGQSNASEAESNLLSASQENLTINKIDSENNEEDKLYENFNFAFNPRFRGVTKEVVKNATSIEDYFDKDDLSRIEKLYTVTFMIIRGDQRTNIVASGDSRTLNKEQLELLRSSDYSTNFSMRLEFLERKKDGELKDGFSNPHITIVPEKQTTFVKGEEALTNYLKANSLEARKGVNPLDLRPTMLYFTVSKDGKIKDVDLKRPSGNEKLDKRMIELIKKLPGEWNPAEDANGNNVDQELVVSYGSLDC